MNEEKDMIKGFKTADGVVRLVPKNTSWGVNVDSVGVIHSLGVADGFVEVDRFEVYTPGTPDPQPVLSNGEANKTEKI